MKHRIVHTLQKCLVNPPIKLALAMGLPLPGYALLETTGRKSWISRLKYDEQALIELMHTWRFAVITYLAEALKRRAIGPELSGQELRTLLEVQYERDWHVYVTSTMSK